jgi:hypothetical protein
VWLPKPLSTPLRAEREVALFTLPPLESRAHRVVLLVAVLLAVVSLAVLLPCLLSLGTAVIALG